jgi:hypothetical protein
VIPPSSISSNRSVSRKASPFNPDSATNAIFDKAARQAGALLEQRFDSGFPAFYEGTHWTMPVSPELVKAMQSGFSDPDSYPIDARGLTYTYAFVGIKNLGAGKYYLFNIRDKDGDPFHGGRNYHLHVPPNPPVKQYWSVTVYDRALHTLLRNVKRASRASNASDVQKNDDGSVDIYFGPEPPGKESNWATFRHMSGPTGQRSRLPTAHGRRRPYKKQTSARPLLALSGHATGADECLLSGVKADMT